MPKPSRLEALAVIREHYNLTLSQLADLMNEPTQPKGLRDEIAISAMNAEIIARGRYGTPKLIAETAYQYADAMLEARLKKETK